MDKRFKFKWLIAFLIIIFSMLLSSCAQKLDCSSATDKFDCYEVYYSKAADKKGVYDSIAELKQQYAADQYVHSQCHQLMHAIGRSASEKYENVSKAFAEGDSFCWSGYYHGVMEGTLLFNPKLVDNEINSACKDVPGRWNYSFDYYNCVHGLGHGIMYLNGHELFDSLETCNNLNGSYEQSSCWSGAFMENVIFSYKDHISKYLNPEDPLYPCNAVEAKYKQTCYLMQTSYMLKITAGNFSKVFDLCSTVEKPYIDTCYQSLGRDASGNSLSDPEITKQTCLLGKDLRQQSNCVIGAVKDFISYFHSDAQANEFCSILSPELQTICFETAKFYYINF